jgi:hypothetical protein
MGCGSSPTATTFIYERWVLGSRRLLGLKLALVRAVGPEYSSARRPSRCGLRPGHDSHSISEVRSALRPGLVKSLSAPRIGRGTRSRLRSFRDGLRGAPAQGRQAGHPGRAKPVGVCARRPPPALRQLLLRPPSVCRTRGRSGRRNEVHLVFRAQLVPVTPHEAPAPGAAPRPASHDEQNPGHPRNGQPCCNTPLPPSPPA